MRETVAAQVHVEKREKKKTPLETLSVVSERHGLPTLAERLAALQGWLNTELSDLEEHIQALCNEPKSDRAWSAAQYLLAQKGKRIRPVCVMLAARMGGRDFDVAIRNVAMACELVHSATLLHDDVLDLGDKRRDVPTARVIYGNSASVLGGDHLLIEALRRVFAAEPTLAPSLVEVIDDMVTAEALQLDARDTFDPSKERYLDIVGGKTAVLFRWALEAGGQLGGLSSKAIENLANVGTYLGITFQMVDDILDFKGASEDTGKTALRDLKEGKITWPLLLAFERDQELRETVKHCIEAGITIDGELCERVAASVEATNALTDTALEAKKYADAALGALQTLPSGEAKHALETVIFTALERSK